MAAAIPPNKLVIFGALAVAGIWYMRQARASGTSILPGLRPAAVNSNPSYRVTPAQAGLTQPAIPTNAKPASLLSTLFGGGSGNSVITPAGRAAVTAGDPYYGSSAVNAAIAAAGKFLSGVPDANARAAVRAGDTYYGAGSAGNNVITDPQDGARAAVRSGDSYYSGSAVDQPSDATQIAQDGGWAAVRAGDSYYGNSDTGPITATYGFDTSAQDAGWAAVRAGDTYYAGAQDQVAINPAPGSDYVPDDVYAADTWASDDYGLFF